MEYFEKLFSYNVFFGYYQQNMSWAVKNYKTVDTLFDSTSLQFQIMFCCTAILVHIGHFPDSNFVLCQFA